MTKIKQASPFFIIIALIWISYVNSINGAFVFDDIYDIVQNENIKDITHVFNVFTIKAQHRDTQYRPIPWILSAIDYCFWGLNPSGFHITNILLHTLNTLFLYMVLRAHFSASSPNEIFIYLLLSSLYFAVHPINTESVAYIKNREVPLAFFFLLFSFFLWTKAIKENNIPSLSRKKKVFIFCSCLLYLTGIFTKENVVILPAILFCYGVLFIGWKGWRSLFDWGLQYYFLCLVLGSIPTLLFRYYGFERLSTDNTLPEGIMIFYTVISTYMYYFRMILFPINQTVDVVFLTYSPFMTFLFVLGIISFLFFLIKKNHKGVLFLFLWFLITLFPVSNILYFETRQIAEQRLYTPSSALALFLPAMVLITESRKNRIYFYFAHLCIIFLFICLTISRNKVWENPLTLWKDASVKSPQKGRTHFQYAKQLLKNNEMDKALEEFLLSMTLEPRSEGFNDIGNIYAMKKQYDKSLSAYQQALSLNPKNGDTAINMGILYMNQKKYDQALHLFMGLLKERPTSWFVLQNIGILYSKKKIWKEVIYYMEKSLEIKGDALSWYTLAQAYERERFFNQAIAAYTNAETERSLLLDILYKRGSIYLHIGKIQNAINDLTEFIRGKPDSITGLNNLANALSQARRKDDAIGYYKKALQYQPENSITLFNLAMTYYQLKQYPDAKKRIKQALRINPALTQGYILMTHLFIDEGDSQKAKKYMDKVITMDTIQEKTKNRLLERINKRFGH